jgi:retron-type reverse transcriptase
VPKQGKPPNEVSSYRPISLLSVLSKILKKPLLIKLAKEPNSMDWIPWHQFGFRKGHSTIQQCHRIVDTINKTLEDKKYCPAVFLDVTQAFDKVWHRGLLLKIQQTLPKKYFRIPKSYLHCRYLTITYNSETSSPIPMHSGVPQGSILRPLLYKLYTADIPQSPHTTLST